MNWDERGNLDLLAASSPLKEFATRSDKMSLVRCGPIILLFIPLITTQSQPPTPAPIKPAQKNQNEAGPKNGKAESNNNPPSQNVFNGVTVVTSGDQQKSSTNGKNESPTDWWAVANAALVTIFTGVLALLAYRQWQTLKGHEQAFKELAGYMRDGLVETTKAADAAKESADAARDSFIASHRPRLTVKFVTTVSEIGEAGEAISGDCLVFNTGGTTANLDRCYSEVVFGDGLPMRSKQYVEGPSEALSGIVLLPGQSAYVKFPTGGPKTLDYDERLAIRKRLESANTDPMSGNNWAWNNLFLIGWIGYIDESKRTRRAGFCRKYDFTAKRFVVDTDHDYEYED